MRYFLCSAVFCLVGVFLVQHAATIGAVQGQSSQSQAGAVRQSLQLTATVVAQEYCRNRVSQESQLDLKLKLSLKNTSDTTLIVFRYVSSLNRLVLSKSLKKAESEDYVYDQRYTSMRLPSLESVDIYQLSPTVEFVTLKPGESFDYKYPQRIDITLTDADEPDENLSPGRYFLQAKIRSWPWNEETFNSLEQHWAQIGSLWYWNITSEPLAISIEKSKSTTTICKDP